MSGCGYFGVYAPIMKIILVKKKVQNSEVYTVPCSMSTFLITPSVLCFKMEMYKLFMLFPGKMFAWRA